MSKGFDHAARRSQTKAFDGLLHACIAQHVVNALMFKNSDLPKHLPGIQHARRSVETEPIPLPPLIIGVSPILFFFSDKS